MEAEPLPRVSIVDLREELKAGNRSVLSRELRQKMKGRFEKKEQVMLFSEQKRIRRFCILPVLWTCDEVSAL